jgi:hypothetical protein
MLWNGQSRNGVASGPFAADAGLLCDYDFLYLPVCHHKMRFVTAK